MRELIEKRIIENWVKGFDEMTNVAFLMGWETDWDNASMECRIVKNWRLVLRNDSADLRECIKSSSDEALIEWFSAQLCMEYR